MTGLLTIPLVLVAIIGCFWWLWTPWIIIGALGGIVLLLLVGALQVKVVYQPELSPEANDMFRMYRGYFRFPSASREFSGTASMVQLSCTFVAAVHAYQYSWWFLIVGVVGYVTFAPVAVKLNPENFLKDDYSRSLFTQVVDHLQEQRQIALDRYREERSIKAPEPQEPLVEK